MDNKKLMILREGREKSLLRRHPWVFSGAVKEVRGSPEAGETVEIWDGQGQFLGRGAYSPQSQIAARVWTFDEAEAVDETFLRSRLAQAMALREKMAGELSTVGQETNAYRLVHAESDGLPGLVVDKYADLLSVQFLSAGAERWRDTITGLLEELLTPRAIYERSDAEVRKLEGLAERSGLLRGALPEEPVTILENGLRFEVEVGEGHKTGYYLDQRKNRATTEHLAQGKRVLDGFCYSGGFTAHALRGGAAQVVGVDSSANALEQARRNLAQNGLDDGRAEFLEADMFQALRRMRDRRAEFDLIVLDPPKFAPTAAHAEKAARAYKDINLLAFKLLARRGVLVTFSCSGGVNAELFQKIVAGAALDAGVEGRILQRLNQGADHPVGLNFPEGEYLKGLVVGI